MSGSVQAGARSGLRAGIALGVFILVAVLIYTLSDDSYLWFKAFHIMAVIAWMAGLFYLPRLFIYHSDVAVGSESSELFKTMESRLYRIIMNPAMMMAWIFGLFIAWQGMWFSAGWLHVKFLGVIAMTGMHVYYGRAVKAFSRDERPRNIRHWRIMNEVPALLMILIVLMAVLKPF
ncbi:protoporphyrinogen oxidase HemJ [Rhizobium sp. LjRoot254]|uniref:protoporphyrinogen oxidase HemJ n=1 Tax=Rhizobium sp. LjRoot254 TaxID=3342297 RepID=UPI003ECD3291